MGIFVIVIGGILFGSILSHYSSYLINKSEDCEKPVDHNIISTRNFVICLLNGILWGLTYYFVHDTLLMIVYMLVASIILTISVIDFAVFEIPPQFNIMIASLAIICVVHDYTNWYHYLIGAVCVSGIFLIIAIATKGNGMGGGDIKLMAAAGLLLGWQKILFVMVIGALLGVFIHGLKMAITKEKSLLAFGPYLSMGIFIMMCYGNQLVDWYKNTFLIFE